MTICVIICVIPAHGYCYNLIVKTKYFSSGRISYLAGRFELLLSITVQESRSSYVNSFKLVKTFDFWDFKVSGWKLTTQASKFFELEMIVNIFEYINS